MPIQVATGIPHLHQEEREKPLPCPRLSEAQCDDNGKNTYPLPLIPDILKKLSKAKAGYFTKLDF